VVQKNLNGHDPRIGHKPVSGLHSIDPAPARRDADRSTLVSTQRHIRFAQRHHHSRSRRRTSRRIAPLVWIVHRPFGSRVAAARQTIRLTVGLSHNLRPGVEQPCHHRCIDLRNVPFQDRVAVHHWHSRNHRVVLDPNFLPLERPRSRTANRSLHIPCVVCVFLRRRKPSRCARILHLRQTIRHPIHHVVGLDARFHQPDVGLHVRVRQRKPNLVRRRANLFGCW